MNKETIPGRCFRCHLNPARLQPWGNPRLHPGEFHQRLLVPAQQWEPAWLLKTKRIKNTVGRAHGEFCGIRLDKVDMTGGR